MGDCHYFYKGNEYTKEQMMDVIRSLKQPTNVTEPYRNYTINDVNAIRSVFDVAPDTTLKQHIANILPNELDRLLNLNADVKFEFDEYNNTEYNPATNTISISLSEIYQRTNEWNMDYVDVLSFFIRHEMGHAITTAGLQKGNNEDILTKMYNRVLALQATKPFIDEARGGIHLENGLAYTFKDIYEFAAEAHSNPYFIKYLQSIKNVEGISIWDRLINFFRELLGMGPKDSQYDEIMDFLNSQRFAEAQYEVLNEDEMAPMSLLETQHAAQFWYNTYNVLLNRGGELDDDIVAIFDKIPSAISKLKAQLKDGKLDVKQATIIKNLIEKFYNFRDKKDRIASAMKMLNVAYNTAQDLKQKMADIETKPVGERLLALNGAMNIARSLDFLIPLTNEIDAWLNKPGNKTADTEIFSRQLGAIRDIKNTVEYNYVKLARPTLIKLMASELGELPAAAKYLKEKEAFVEQLKVTTNPLMIKRIQEKIDAYDELIDQLPIPATLEKAMAGQLKDAHMTDLNFNAMALNSHSVIQALHSMIRRKDHALTNRTLDLKNEMQDIIDTFKKNSGIKSFRQIQEVTEPVTEDIEFVDEVIENETTGELTFKTTITKTLIDKYNSTYHSEVVKLQKILDFYNEKRNVANISEADDIKYNKLFNEAKVKIKLFKRTHGEQEFNDEYYIPIDILDEEIFYTDVDGKESTFTLRQEREDLFDAIAEAEIAKQQEVQKSAREEATNNLNDVNRDFMELSSLWDKNGNEKTGKEKLLAEQAIKYSEARKKTGTRVQTEEDKEMFAIHKAVIEDRYIKDLRSANDNIESANREYTAGKMPIEKWEDTIKRLNAAKQNVENEYVKSLERIEITRPTDEYFSLQESTDKAIEDIKNLIFADTKLAAAFTERDKDLMQKSYKKLSDLVKAYRDNHGVVDGISFQKNKPEAVKLIKEIQQELELVNEAVDSISGLSKKDRMRYDKLKDKVSTVGMTGDERTEYATLNKLKNQKETFAKPYLTKKDPKVPGSTDGLLTLYKLAIQERTKLSSSTTSEYYTKYKDGLLNDYRMKAERDIREDLQTYLTDEGINRENGQFIRETTDKNVITKDIVAKSEVEMIAILAKKKADSDLLNSEWWKNNHYTVNKYNNLIYRYEEVDEPIYIWNKKTPTDPKHIMAGIPSYAYTTFVSNENMKNENFKLIAHNISTPKKSSMYFGNKNYNALTPAYKTLAESLRKFKYRTEEDTEMSSSQRTYNILPSIPKTQNENKIDFTTALLAGKTLSNIKSALYTPSDSEDEQFAQRGSMKKSAIVPFRYNNVLSKDKISMNLFASMLSYDNANANAANMKELEPIFEAAVLSTKDLNTIKKDRVKGAFKIMDLGRRIIGKKKGADTEEIVTTVVEGNSVLHKTVVHMLDTFIHGETRTLSIMDLGSLGTVDAHKLVGNIKGLASRVIFAGKIFSPIKNSMAGKINALVNSNLGEKFFTKMDYANASIQAPKYIPDLIKDYKRLGNKSFIGQVMDKFQVLHGGIQNEFGQDIQWSGLTEAGHFLTIAKNISELELQLSSFLAISKANQVTLKDGTKVDFHEAYEMKGGKLEQKDGANLTENDTKSFTEKVAIVNRFINGAFRQDEKAMIEKHPLGNMFYFLNGYVMPGLKNRYASSWYSVEADMQMKGYYREGLKFAADWFKYGRDLNVVWSTLNNEEKGRVMRFVKEVGTAMTLLFLTILMGSGDDKDKLKKNAPAYNFLLALTMATASEVQTFIPIPGLGFDEIMRKLKSPFAAVSQVINLYTMFTNMMALINPLDPNTGRYKSKGIDDGFHDVGDSKFVADLVKFSGYNFKEWSPIDKLMTVKQMQTIRP